MKSPPAACSFDSGPSVPPQNPTRAATRMIDSARSTVHGRGMTAEGVGHAANNVLYPTLRVNR
jgi:hypothetical protein